MFIESVTLNSFKKHEHLHVDFSQGVNIIAGPNYAGKSTIAQAILLGLYGNAVVPGNVGLMVRDGAKDFSVTLKLDNGVEIVRSKGDSIFKQDGHVVAVSHTAVNEHVAATLGMDRQTFMRIFASEQGSPQALLAMDGIELQRFVESCIGVEKLDAIVKAAKSKLTSLKASYEAQSGLMEEDIASLRKELDTSTESVSLHGKNLAEAEASLVDATKMVEDFMAEINVMTKAKASWETYGQQRDFLNREVSKYREEDMVSTKEREDQLAEYKANGVLVGRRKQLENKVRALTLDISDSKSQLVDLDSKEFNDAEEATLRDQLAELKSTISSEGREIQTLKKTLEGLTCPTCKRPFDDDPDHKARTEAALLETQAALLEHEKDLHQLEGRLVKVISDNKAYRRVQESNVRIEEFCKVKQQELSLVEEELAKIPDDLVFDSAQVEDLEKSIRSDIVANAKIAENNKTRLRLIKQLEELQTPECAEPVGDAIESLVGLCQRAKDDRDALQRRIPELRGIARDVADKASSLRERVRKHDEIAVAVSKTREDLDTYATLHPKLSEARRAISENSMYKILQVASEFVKAVTDGDISEIQIAFESICYREGDKVRPKTSASGAQKTLMGIGIKLGLLQLVGSKFGCLVLDEISADMDENISLKCMQAIKLFSKQVVAISHRKMDVADNLIEVGVA